ncbi:MAG TPA: hypothetical protein VNS32_16975 [Flavisolibacter sp.]|nr:hypothetical protein [Flavisolibacter sp.]
MFSHVKQQVTDLWEVWIEYDQFNSEYFGTLYIFGEVVADQHNAPPLIKKVENCKGVNELCLMIPAVHSPNKERIIEVCYSEPIKDLNQYSSICIYSGNELLVQFHEIEVMI